MEMSLFFEKDSSFAEQTFRSFTIVADALNIHWLSSNYVEFHEPRVPFPTNKRSNDPIGKKHRDLR
jgi:hypothetical protein